jgi:hypothetical protein
VRYEPPRRLPLLFMREIVFEDKVNGLALTKRVPGESPRSAHVISDRVLIAEDCGTSAAVRLRSSFSVG